MISRPLSALLRLAHFNSWRWHCREKRERFISETGNNNPRFRSFLRCGAEIICHSAFSIQEIRRRDEDDTSSAEEGGKGVVN